MAARAYRARCAPRRARPLLRRRPCRIRSGRGRRRASGNIECLGDLGLLLPRGGQSRNAATPPLTAGLPLSVPWRCAAGTFLLEQRVRPLRLRFSLFPALRTVCVRSARQMHSQKQATPNWLHGDLILSKCEVFHGPDDLDEHAYLPLPDSLRAHASVPLNWSQTQKTITATSPLSLSRKLTIRHTSGSPTTLPIYSPVSHGPLCPPALSQRRLARLVFGLLA